MRRQTRSRILGGRSECHSAGLVPKRQLLLKRPRLTKVLTLAVDDESARLFGAGPAPVVPLSHTRSAASMVP